MSFLCVDFLFLTVAAWYTITDTGRVLPSHPFTLELLLPVCLLCCKSLFGSLILISLYRSQLVYALNQTLIRKCVFLSLFVLSDLDMYAHLSVCLNQCSSQTVVRWTGCWNVAVLLTMTAAVAACWDLEAFLLAAARRRLFSSSQVHEHLYFCLITLLNWYYYTIYVNLRDSFYRHVAHRAFDITE